MAGQHAIENSVQLDNIRPQSSDHQADDEEVKRKNRNEVFVKRVSAIASNKSPQFDRVDWRQHSTEMSVRANHITFHPPIPDTS